jgi:hypothetical protein
VIARSARSIEHRVAASVIVSWVLSIGHQETVSVTGKLAAPTALHEIGVVRQFPA